MEIFYREQVKWLSSLQFAHPKIAEKIKKRSEKALKKGYFSLRQKWLGAYYSKEIRLGHHPHLIVQWIGAEIGYGVMAGESLAKGAFIGEYTGIVRRRTRKDRQNFYCFEYAVGDDWKSPFIIDAKDQGNYTRFINHSSSPNLEPVSVYLEGLMHLILIANRPIQKGEHLCYDYGEDYWRKRIFLPLPMPLPG